MRKDLDPAFLQSLNKLAFTLHAVRGLSQPFEKSRRRTAQDYERYGMSMPTSITPERMTDGFVEAIDQRHYSPAQLKAMAESISGPLFAADPLTRQYNGVASKIIILTRFREAVHQVALNQVFGSPKRRDEFYMAIIEALEDLEDEFEDLDEKLHGKSDE
jgi:type III secretion protein W